MRTFYDVMFMCVLYVCFVTAYSFSFSPALQSVHSAVYEPLTATVGSKMYVGNRCVWLCICICIQTFTFMIKCLCFTLRSAS